MRSKSLRRSSTVLTRNILGTAVFDTEQHYSNRSAQSMAETREIHGPTPARIHPRRLRRLQDEYGRFSLITQMIRSSDWKTHKIHRLRFKIMYRLSWGDDEQPLHIPLSHGLAVALSPQESSQAHFSLPFPEDRSVSWGFAEQDSNLFFGFTRPLQYAFISHSIAQEIGGNLLPFNRLCVNSHFPGSSN